MKTKLKDYLDYSKYYTRGALWDKIAAVSKKAGAKVIRMVLLLYYAATDPAMPIVDKAKIYGALGYFILPLDLVPDMTPVLGFSDDMAALLWAFKSVASHITPETQHKADRKLGEWFGNDAPDDSRPDKIENRDNEKTIL